MSDLKIRKIGIYYTLNYAMVIYLTMCIPHINSMHMAELQTILNTLQLEFPTPMTNGVVLHVLEKILKQIYLHDLTTKNYF